MDGEGQQRGGANNRRRRRRPNPRDGRDVPQHVHQLVFKQTNTNRDDNKAPKLEDLIKRLRGQVDEKHLNLKYRYQNLPEWTPQQPPGVGSHYKGMQTVMTKMHYNRCKYLYHLVEGCNGCGGCELMKTMDVMLKSDLASIQREIEKLHGRAWMIPQGFGLELTLLGKADD